MRRWQIQACMQMEELAGAWLLPDLASWFPSPTGQFQTFGKSLQSTWRFKTSNFFHSAMDILTQLHYIWGLIDGVGNNYDVS
jgi:hypothetical protein